jgi:hypothetical protein
MHLVKVELTVIITTQLKTVESWNTISPVYRLPNSLSTLRVEGNDF